MSPPPAARARVSGRMRIPCTAGSWLAAGGGGTAGQGVCRGMRSQGGREGGRGGERGAPTTCHLAPPHAAAHTCIRGPSAETHPLPACLPGPPRLLLPPQSGRTPLPTPPSPTRPAARATPTTRHSPRPCSTTMRRWGRRARARRWGWCGGCGGHGGGGGGHSVLPWSVPPRLAAAKRSACLAPLVPAVIQAPSAPPSFPPRPLCRSLAWSAPGTSAWPGATTPASTARVGAEGHGALGHGGRWASRPPACLPACLLLLLLLLQSVLASSRSTGAGLTPPPLPVAPTTTHTRCCRRLWRGPERRLLRVWRQRPQGGAGSWMGGAAGWPCWRPGWLGRRPADPHGSHRHNTPSLPSPGKGGSQPLPALQPPAQCRCPAPAADAQVPALHTPLPPPARSWAPSLHTPPPTWPPLRCASRRATRARA